MHGVPDEVGDVWCQSSEELSHNSASASSTQSSRWSTGTRITMDNSTLVSTDILKELLEFLNVTLAKEALSLVASTLRRDLATKLLPLVHKNAADRYGSSYLDMTVGVNKATPALPTVDDLEEYVDVDESAVMEDEYEECPAEFEAVLQEKAANQMTLPPDITEEVKDKTDRTAIPAADLKDVSLKVGPLFRKERVFFIEQFRRCWAAVHESRMYFYGSEKDSKPSLVVDLAEYSARPKPSQVKDAKKKDNSFELVAPGKKTIQLVARTTKDMQQWVSTICKSSSTTVNTTDIKIETAKTTRRELPSIPDSDESDTYDDIDFINPPIPQPPSAAAAPVEIDDEEIYHVPDEIHTFEDDVLEEEIYDDIGQIYPNSVYYNVSKDQEDVHISNNIIEVSKDTEKNAELPEKLIEEEEEELYDDISAYQISDLLPESISIDPIEVDKIPETALEGKTSQLYENGKKTKNTPFDMKNQCLEVGTRSQTNLIGKRFQPGLKSPTALVGTKPPPLKVGTKSETTPIGIKPRSAQVGAKSPPSALGSKPIVVGKKPQLAAVGLKSHTGGVARKVPPIAGVAKSQPQANKKIQDLIQKMETSLKWNNPEGEQ